MREIARYCAEYGDEQLRSVVFASAVTPYLLHAPDNPDGPLTQPQAAGWTKDIMEDENSFYERFTTQFSSTETGLKASDTERQEALGLCRQADKTTVLGCMQAFETTDFREDLIEVSVPALILHGDSDGTVPFEGSGTRTHAAPPGSELHVIAGAPHGCYVSHADEFNQALLAFLAR